MATHCDQYVLRLFRPEDYEEYSGWWEDPPQKESLPRIGIVSGDMKAVGFVADTDTDISILTFWDANPENTARESYKALDSIIYGAITLSRHMGKAFVFCFTNRSGMRKLLKKQGFEEREQGHLIMRL